MTISNAISNGFVLSELSIQVFEKKPKESKPEAGQGEDKVHAQFMEVCLPIIWHPFMKMVTQNLDPFMQVVSQNTDTRL